MKYKIIKNDTGIKNSTISRYISLRGEDYVRSIYGNKVSFISGDDAKKITAHKNDEAKAIKDRDVIKNREDRYRGSIFASYYLKIGNLQKMADVLGVSKQRVHQMMTSGVHYNKIDNTIRVLDGYIKSLDIK